MNDSLQRTQQSNRAFEATCATAAQAPQLHVGGLMKANSGIPLSEWSGSGATRELHETIKLQIAATDRQSKVIIRLTWFMAVLAVVQTIATIVQVIPLAQSYQDKPAIEKKAETAPQLRKQENQPQPVTHASTAEPARSVPSQGSGGKPKP